MAFDQSPHQVVSHLQVRIGEKHDACLSVYGPDSSSRTILWRRCKPCWARLAPTALKMDLVECIVLQACEVRRGKLWRNFHPSSD